MYKLQYPRLKVSTLKEPPILKMIFCSAGYDTPCNQIRIRISQRIQNRYIKYILGHESAAHIGLIHEKKTEAKNLVLLYL
jgi:hypothetical protein